MGVDQMWADVLKTDDMTLLVLKMFHVSFKGFTGNVRTAIWNAGSWYF